MTPVPPDLLEALIASQSVLAISHVKPDGDAIGSLLGIGYLLRMLGKEVTLTLQDEVPQEFHPLPGAESIVPPASVRGVFDTLVVVDSSSPRPHGRRLAR